MVAHVTACGCNARFSNTAILERSGNCSLRLALEAVLIEKNRDHCISEPSIALPDPELEFMRNCR